jgi:hypothetical protein
MNNITTLKRIIVLYKRLLMVVLEVVLDQRFSPKKTRKKFDLTKNWGLLGVLEKKSLPF